jgi:hypothetical protein
MTITKMAFFSTYELYKQGTRTIVNWLATTAARCGYETPEQHKRRIKNQKKYERKKKNKLSQVDASVARSESRGESSSIISTGSELSTRPVAGVLSDTNTKSSTSSVESASTNPTAANSQTKIQAQNDQIPKVQPATRPTKYTISNNELPRMATFISENFEQASKIEALPETLKLLQDVISK